jgi:succinate-acetate transporter protein
MMNSTEDGIVVGSVTDTDLNSSPKARKSRHVRIKSAQVMEAENHRLVVVRYFLDRPGYDLHNAASRFWFFPPAETNADDVLNFLTEQNIALPGLLIEIYLDRFEAYMLLEACRSCSTVWDFAEASFREPGILNIRLTDMDLADQEQSLSESEKSGIAPSKAQTKQQPQLANVTPAGLFSFSMMVGLETVSLMPSLMPGTVSESYVLAWGPYMYFVGGLMQILVATFQVLRNNAYGATAFFGFGSFWFSFGSYTILRTFFASEGTVAYDMLEGHDPWGSFFRSMFVFAFSVALLIQTFAMNRLSSTLIGLLCFKMLFSAFAGWSVALRWCQFVFGWMTSVFAFYVFVVELTNSIYHREVFPVYKWSLETSPDEAFGAPGRTGTLYSKAARLRRASYPNVRKIRSAPYMISEDKPSGANNERGR